MKFYVGLFGGSISKFLVTMDKKATIFYWGDLESFMKGIAFMRQEMFIIWR